MKKPKNYKENLKKIASTNKFDVWNLDVEFAEFIIPRLKILKKIQNGVPGALVDDNESFSESLNKYHQILDDIIAGFKIIKKSDNYTFKPEKLKKVQKSLDLFAKHLTGMWT
jgi:hypothetical protein